MWDERIADLERKLAARRNKREFRDSVPAIEAELERLKAARDAAQVASEEMKD